MSILMPVLHYCYLVSFESKKCESCKFGGFFPQDSFGYSWLNTSYINLKVKLSNSGNNKASLEIDKTCIEYETALLRIYMFVYNCYVFLKNYFFIIIKRPSLYHTMMFVWRSIILYSCSHSNCLQVLVYIFLPFYFQSFLHSSI